MQLYHVWAKSITLYASISCYFICNYIMTAMKGITEALMYIIIWAEGVTLNVIGTKRITIDTIASGCGQNHFFDANISMNWATC